MMDEDQLLKIRMARSFIARTRRILNGWFRWRVRSASPEELLSAERELIEKARIETRNGGVPSLGRIYSAWREHPLTRLLFLERLRREVEIEWRDPKDYLGSLYDLAESEIKDYLIWKGERHGSVQEWKRDKRRSLKVITSNEKIEEHNGRLSSSGEGSPPIQVNRESGIESSKTLPKGQRAYTPGRKREGT